MEAQLHIAEIVDEKYIMRILVDGEGFFAMKKIFQEYNV